jgi:hypothetical protein
MRLYKYLSSRGYQDIYFEELKQVTDPHSVRNAAIGSRREARRAGR